MSNDFGAGQMQPTDWGSDFNTMAFIARSVVARINVAMPVEVKAVANGEDGALASWTVDVQPLVSTIDGAGNAQQHGVVYGLPVMRIGGGDLAIMVKPKVGDVGQALFNDRDISAVKGAGGAATPGSRRRFSMADGVYLGAMLSGEPTSYVLVADDAITLLDGESGTKLELKADGVWVTGNLHVTGDIEFPAGSISAGGAAIAGDLTLTAGSGTGKLQAAGAVVAGHGGVDEVTLQHHTHGGVAAGAAQTAAPTAGT